MPMTPKQMIRLLQENGFEIVRQKGSHVRMLNRITNITTTVPLHGKDLSKGLEQAILKQAGVKQSFKEEDYE